MHVRKDASGTYIVGMERGDDLRSCVTSLAEREGIRCARVSGTIGAVADPEIGYYDLERKEYLRDVLSGDWELVSLSGNITMKDGAPFLHAHVAVADRSHDVRGGHLFDAAVAVVVEMFIDPFEEPLERRDVEEVGLACWHLAETDADG